MSGAASDGAPAPEGGQAVLVRNRPPPLPAPHPHDPPRGKGHLRGVDVGSLDAWRYPEAEQLLGEVETRAKVRGKPSLPSVDAPRPDGPEALRAFVNAQRWPRLNRLRESDDLTGEPI